MNSGTAAHAPRIDSDRLHTVIRQNIEQLCQTFFPKGKKENGEWRIGNVQGDAGRSLGISLRGEKAGLWYDQATGEGRGYGFVKLVEVNRNLRFPEAARLIASTVGVCVDAAPNGNGNGHHPNPFDWSSLDRLNAEDQSRLAKWRNYSEGMVAWMVQQDLVRILTFKGVRCWAFPVVKGGEVKGCHHRPIQAPSTDRVKWGFEPAKDEGGPGVQPFVIGEPSMVRVVHVFESTWDMLAACDRLKFHESKEAAAFCTRGAGNWRLVQQIPNHPSVYVWPQNDPPDERTRKVPSETWFQGIQESLSRPFHRVTTPLEFGDLNDWTRSGASLEDLLAAVKNATLQGEIAKAEPDHTQEPGDFSPAILKIIEKEGAPATFGPKGRVTKLNEPFWAALHAQEHVLLYEPTYGKFFSYDAPTGTWVEQSENCIRKEMECRIFEASKQWEKYGGVSEHRNAASLSGIITHLRGEVEKRKAFDQDPNLIHLSNCTLKVTLDGWSSMPVGRENYALSRSPIIYDPAADCPQFKEKLLSPLNTDDQVVLQKLAALTLTGENPLQRFLVVDGVPGAGKSTYILVLAELLGPAKCTPLRTKYLGDRFEIGQLRGKSLLTGPDVDADFFDVKGASTVKSLCGGDCLKGEIKGGNEIFDVPGRFNIAISANTRLKIRMQGDDGAWLRRLVLIRYEKAYPVGTRVLDYHKVLVRQEGAGILNWALAGLKLLKRDIDETGDIRLSADQKDRIDSLVKESESLRHFLKERVCARRGHDITVDELVTAFTGFCQDRNWSVDPVKKVQGNLETLIMELFGAARSNNLSREGKPSVRGYRGIAFRGNDEPDPF